MVTGNAGVDEVHGDPAAHGAGPDDSHRFHRDRRGAGRQSGDLPHFALGEEHIALGGRLRAGDQPTKQFLLDLEALIERQRHRRLDRLDDRLRRLEAAELPGVGRPKRREIIGRHRLHRPVADLDKRRPLGRQAAGERDGVGPQGVLAGQLVDQAHLQTFLGRHMVAGRHHLQRPPGTGDPGEALSAARPRQQPQVDLGQPAAGARDGDPVVGAQGHLEATSEGGPVDGGDDRLRRALHHRLHLEEAGPPRAATKLRDVGPGDEGATTADEHDGCGRRIGDGGLEPFEQAVAHVEAQGVDRRRIEGDNGDITVESEVGDLVDSRHERSRLIGGQS